MVQVAGNTAGERFSEVMNRLKTDRKIKREGEIAEKTHYKPSTISEIKAGRQEPPERILNFLKDHYDVNPDFILMGDGSVYLFEMKNHGEAGGEGIKNPDPFKDQDQLTKQILANLSESNKALAIANQKLSDSHQTLSDAHLIITRNNDELLQIVKRSTVVTGVGIPQFVNDGMTMILRYLAKIGSGSLHWNSEAEAVEALNRDWLGIEPPNFSKGNFQGQDKQDISR